MSGTETSESNITYLTKFFVEPMSVNQSAQIAAAKVEEARKDTVKHPRAKRRKQAYFAATELKQGEYMRFFRVNYLNGHVDLWAYDFMENIFSADENKIVMHLNGGAVFLRGENLRPLMNALQQQRVQEIFCFDPEQHQLPKEGETIINWIEWKPRNRVRPREE